MNDNTKVILARLRLVQAWKTPGGPHPDLGGEMPRVDHLCRDAIAEIEAIHADRVECSRQTREALQRLEISERRLQGYIDMRTPGKGKLVQS